MTRRYCGSLTISVRYNPRVWLGSIGTDWYDCRVTLGRVAEVFCVHAPRVGFGAGVAYDSPEAYDSIARAAVGFACQERAEHANDFDAAAEFEDTSMQLRIRRKK